MSWGHEEKKEASIEALAQIKKLSEQCFWQKSEVDAKKILLKREEVKLTALTNSLLPLLEAAGMTKLAIEGCGDVVVDQKMSVKVPKDPEERKKFFDYLKSKGVFEDIVTVHSATLNSFYNAELATAKDEGNADFQVPGITPSGAWSRLKLKNK